MAKNSLLVIPCNEDTALRLKETLEKKYGTVPGFCVTIDLDESNLIRIQKENLDFSSFLELCHICEQFECHVISQFLYFYIRISQKFSFKNKEKGNIICCPFSIYINLLLFSLLLLVLFLLVVLLHAHNLSILI